MANDEERKFPKRQLHYPIFVVSAYDFHHSGPLWPEEPAVRFAQIEGNFVLSGIKDGDKKIYCVVAQLEQRYAAEIKDISFQKLKIKLIRRLSSASREDEVKQLLMHEELGDRRPSQFLGLLLHLASPEDFIRSIWTSRLPVNLEMVKASQSDSTLQYLGDLAEMMIMLHKHDLVPSSPHVAAAAISSSLIMLDMIAKQISQLARKVESLSTRDKRRSRSRQRYNRRSRSRNNTRSHSCYRKFLVCFYHHKCGEQARNFLKPCDYHKENSQGSR